jgi:starch phosphorylase
VHVEDFSTDVLIEDNTFTACGLTEFAHVQVIAGARGVTVRGNRHDASMNTRPIPIVGALPGGEGLTAGGRPLDAPTEVTVADNAMRCGPGITAVAFDDVPVGAITNGVHLGTWVAADMGRLFDRYLDSHWRERCDDPAIWERILAIPDHELWTLQTELRRFLITFVRERARERWMQERVSAGRVVVGGTLLSPDVLTIGFARRFATYKRAELMFRDPDRLARILNNPRRPMQIVFAGKAHPADDGGKRVLQSVYRYASDPAFGGRVAFVDDYDLHVAHYLVQGCDVWLNTPRKPLEASGTSGMKASMNGTINVSIGDGWWAEGYSGSNGFLIDPGIETADQDAMDAADAGALYRLLEEQIVPAYYERDEQDVPRRWAGLIKEAIRTVAPRFCTRRMVKEYVERMYEPAMGLKRP